MNVEHVIQTSLDRSPGFSRSRRAWQYTVAPAGIQPGSSRDSRGAYPGYLRKRHQPVQAFLVVGHGPGRNSTGSSRDSRGAYPGYLRKRHQPGLPFKTAVGAAAVTQKLCKSG